MTTADGPGGRRWLLLARETEQLERVADRIRQERRVLAVLACERAFRGEVLAWLSKAAGRDIPAPVESSAPELLAHLDAAAGGTLLDVVSLAWSTGDRAAIAALNLHREKLRRGASVLLWCAPEDLGTLQTEGQDVYSFRDTLVLISGFALPEVHVPSDDTPEIRLARARLDLPGTLYEKALAAAELGTLLLDRGYHLEAVDVCMTAIEPLLEDDVHEAGRGTIAYLAGALAAALAAAGAVSAARRWADVALMNGLQAGAAEADMATFVDVIEPSSSASAAAARVLQGVAADLPWESFRRQHSMVLAETTARTGQLRAWRPRDDAFPVQGDELDASFVIALARGDVDDATALSQEAAADAARRDEDNRSRLLHLVDCLVLAGEIRCAVDLLGGLRPARPADWLPVLSRPRRAHVLALAGKVEEACRLLRYEEAPSELIDGLVYQRCAALVSVVRAAVSAERLGLDAVGDTASYLSTVEGWFPPPAEGSPPFYPILLPGLRAELLSSIPDRRDEAVDLARGAWELARREVPTHAPPHAVTLVSCLLGQERLDAAMDVLSLAEPDAERMEDLRALAVFRLVRVLVDTLRGEGASAVGSAMSALREALDATGSRRIVAEGLLSLARSLPPQCTRPDVITLVDEASEHFADMPMLGHEERCRETKGDALLGRGDGEQAAGCYSAAAKRLRHHGLLLRVPLLRAKRRRALGAPAAGPASSAAKPG